MVRMMMIVEHTGRRRQRLLVGQLIAGAGQRVMRVSGQLAMARQVVVRVQMVVDRRWICAAAAHVMVFVWQRNRSFRLH